MNKKSMNNPIAPMLVFILAASACVAPAQTMLDQDPAARAQDEAFFAHPPASSIAPPSPLPGAASEASQRPVTSLIPLFVAEVGTRGRLDRDGNSFGTGYFVTTQQSGRKEVFSSEMEVERKKAKLTGFTVEVKADPMLAQPFTGRLEVALFTRKTSGAWSLAGKVCCAVSIPAFGSLDKFAWTSRIQGDETGWIARLLGPNNSVLGLTASSDDLAANAADSATFYRFTGGGAWVQE
jgi:hypothetical protein